MALALERLYSDLMNWPRPHEIRRDDKRCVPVPEVNPEGPSLDDLFAWGDAVARLGQITPERSKELLALARMYVKDRSLGLRQGPR